MERYIFFLAFSFLQICFVSAQNLDQRLVRRIYEQDDKAFADVMRVTDKAAYPLYVAVPTAFWLSALTENGVSKTEAMSMTVALVSAAGATGVLKKIVGRDRPFVHESGIQCYRGSANCPVDAQTSMPSGHTSMAFAIATSASLMRPKWYVIVPSYLVAGTIATSRMWNGVHYPSDVLAGAVLGTGSALVVHQFFAAFDKGRKSVFVPIQISPTQISFQVSF